MSLSSRLLGHGPVDRSNDRRDLRRARGLAAHVLSAVAVTVLASCEAPAGEIFVISAESLPRCPLDVVATLELEALDDGPARAVSFAEVSKSGALEIPTLPAGARAFAVRGRDRGGARVALGVLRVADGASKGVIYREGVPCSLRDRAGAEAVMPATRDPSVAAGARATIVAGGRVDGAARSDLLVIDPDGARVHRLGLRRRRAEAATVVLGDLALVAGGEAEGAIWEDAEIVALGTTPSVLDAAIALGEPRAEAGAVAMASGEALLVGGRGPRGALRTLEAVDVLARRARTLDLATLQRPRRSPSVVRLATGEIAVVGGRDDAGTTVPDVEIFDARAERLLRVLPLATRTHVAALSLPSGAALVVHGDDGGALAVSFVRADAIEALPDGPPSASAPRLVAATDGAPYLFTDTLRRFDPWTGRFDASLSTLVPTAGGQIFALGEGVVSALELRGNDFVARAVRYDVRTSWVVDPEPLGLGSTAHLVPDRLDARVGRDGMVLGPGARVALADATFRGVDVRLAAPSRTLPDVELRTPEGALVLRVGEGGSCAWPAGDADFADLIREPGGAVTLRVGSATRACAVPSELHTSRVTVTLIAFAREARVRGMTVTRRA